MCAQGRGDERGRRQHHSPMVGAAVLTDLLDASPHPAAQSPGVRSTIQCHQHDCEFLSAAKADGLPLGQSRGNSSTWRVSLQGVPATSFHVKGQGPEITTQPHCRQVIQMHRR